MKHAHKYESISHPVLTAEARELGIKAAEVRQCATCRKQMPFIQAKGSRWVPLFEEGESDQQDILLA